MINFKDVEKSRKILGLDEYATLKDVNAAYRKLASKYHPDKCSDEKEKHDCEQKFKDVSFAKDTLMKYFSQYRYSFKEKDVKRSLYSQDFYKHIDRFFDGWWDEI